MFRRLLLPIFIVALLSTGVMVLHNNPTHAQTSHGGFIDGVDGENNLVGWAYDPEFPSTEVDVKVYVVPDTQGPLSNGEVLGTTDTNIRRIDASRVYDAQPDSGFSIRIPNRYLDGERLNLRVFAVNEDTGAETELANSPFIINAELPEDLQLEQRAPETQTEDSEVVGFVDRVRDGVVQGWAFDDSQPNMPIPVMAYEGDYKTGRLLGVGMANSMRNDVATEFGTEGMHGFEIEMNLNHREFGETVNVRVYAPDRTMGELELVESKMYTLESTASPK